MSDSARDALQLALGSAYTLERELGGGGMSRVFLAEEARLGRKVVVKILTPELGEGVSADRFQREIKLAARLAHPSIVPLLTAGEANGVPYYTMPFVEGESLRARLAIGGRLLLPEVANILRDIARALSYAHEQGIVHRDIKPENVLLASGAAVVTDFGIAKAISVSRTQPGGSTLTRAGTSIGTPAYMAPEQALGDPGTDARADIYAFGCVAYEMLTGEAPFHGRPFHKLLSAQIAEHPADVFHSRPDCPPALGTFIMRCLEKDPDQRPQSALEILPALETVTTPSGAPSSGVVSATSGANWRIRRAILFPAFLTVAVAAAFALYWNKGATGSEPSVATVQSIAVLPFANVGGDTANAYFADGIAEDLATSLSKVEGLRVVARNSSFQSSGRKVDEQEAGRVLNVDALLAGSVRRMGSQMRITVRLIGVKNESLLWSDQYDREVKDVFAVQDEITRSIVGAIGVHFASSGVRPSVSSSLSGANSGTSNLEAHDLYLRAQFNLRRRTVAAAVDYFERAIALDSTYARAYSGLSAALQLTPYFAGLPAESVRARATAAARRALLLDPSLAEAHTALAQTYQHAHQWEDARREHQRAVAVAPGDAAAHMQYARFLAATGNLTAAYDEANRAEALDPFSAVIVSWVSYTALMTGRAEAALAAAKRGLELDPATAPLNLSAAYAYLRAGQKEKAMELIDRLPDVLPWPGLIAYVHASAGDRKTAMRIVSDIESAPASWASGTARAWAYLGLKDTTLALDALERATGDKEIWFMWYTLKDPVYDPVRATPRFAALVRRLRLDEKLFTTVTK